MHFLDFMWRDVIPIWGKFSVLVAVVSGRRKYYLHQNYRQIDSNCAYTAQFFQYTCNFKHNINWMLLV